MRYIKSSLILARKDLKILFKDKGQLAVLFLLPLLLALFMGGSAATMKDPVTTSGEPKLSIKTIIVNEDQGDLGDQVADALRKIKPLSMLSLARVDVADKRVADSEAAAAIIIPEDFSEKISQNQPTQIQLIKDPVQQSYAQVVAGILNEVLTELSVRAEVEYGIMAVYAKSGVLDAGDPAVIRAAQAQTMGTIWTTVQEIRENPAISVQLENKNEKEVVLPISGVVFSFFMPGLATIFAFFMVGNMAESILKEKNEGSFRRLIAAPIHRSTIISGKMLAFIGVVFTQMIVLFGICVVFFDMPLGGSPLALFLITLTLSLAATSMGMLIGSVAKTSKQAGGIGMVAGFVLMIASGFITFYSLNVTGNVAEIGIPKDGFGFVLSRLTPHAHAFDGYLNLFLKGAGLGDVFPNILALLGFAVVFFSLAMWRFKFD